MAELRTGGWRMELRPTGRWSWPVREARLSWRFVYRDLPVSLVPCAFLSLSVSHSVGVSPTGTVVALAKSVLFGCLYMYPFCLANQLAGVEEDRLNKPDRPLVVGLVTPRGAWWRLGVGAGLFALYGVVLGVVLGVLPWADVWLALIVVYNFGGWHRWGPARNFTMVLGTVAQLVPVWQIAGTVDATAWRWILTIAIVYVTPAMHVQDLRDMVGDRAAGRRTLPMMLGDRVARVQLAVYMAIVPFALYGLLYAPEGLRASTLACGAVIAAMCWTVAGRVLRVRTPAGDDRTYLLYECIYCAMLLTGTIVLG